MINVKTKPAVTAGRVTSHKAQTPSPATSHAVTRVEPPPHSSVTSFMDDPVVHNDVINTVIIIIILIIKLIILFVFVTEQK